MRLPLLSHLRAPARRPLARPLGLLPLWAALLTGCAASKPDPTLLTLPAAEVAPPTASGGTATPRVLAVRRVAIPEYLLTRKVRYRADASTLDEWPQAYWAERIEVGVTREFASALRQALPGWIVCEGSCSDRVADLILQVELTPLDFSRAQRSLQTHARVSAAWALTASRGVQLLDQRLQQPATADTPQAQAQALTDVLETVARASAEGLQKLPPPR
ncbi:PqiC family protein [Eleftheria terrae]|uniref:PqiC family protein n=1 Tax=Eleftheria terrae TaxID=1597781 RepID=UPI00263B08FB|nr:ABC-type transport auxiliary lipoprotein family protein [Eleftheria terrae]WKB50957.1 PqiC family protein [Eleftheria terrae]